MKKLLFLIALLPFIAGAQTKTTLASLKSNTTATTKTVYYTVSGKDTTYWKKVIGDYAASDNVIVSKNGAFVKLVPAANPVVKEQTPVVVRKGGIYQAHWPASVTKGSSKIVFATAPALKAGDQLAFEWDGGRGTEGFDNWPEKKVSDIKTPADGQYARDPASGKTMRYSVEKGWEIYYKWDAWDYYSYGWKVIVKAVNGKEVTVDKASPIDHDGTVYFDNHPVLTKILDETAVLNFPALGVTGDVYISEPIYRVNKKFEKVYGYGVTLASIKGFNSAGLWFENGNGITTPEVYGLSVRMHGEFQHFAPPKHVLPKSNETWYDGPYLMSRGIAFWTKGAIGRSLAIYNAPSYALTIGEGSDIVGLRVIMDSSLYHQYTGWPIHLIGGGENGTVPPVLDSFYFYSPVFMRAAELQQTTGGIFRNGTVINGAFSQNQGARGLMENVTFHIKENAAVLDEKMKSHPVIQANQLLSGTNESGMTFRNVHVIQEGPMNPNGEVLKAWEFYPGTRGIKLYNCSSTRPDVPFRDGFWGNSYGSHLGVPADGLEIDGFKAVGKAWPGFDWSKENNTANGPVIIYGAGSGSIKNLEAEKVIIDRAAKVKTENVKTAYPIL